MWHPARACSCSPGARRRRRRACQCAAQAAAGQQEHKGNKSRLRDAHTRRSTLRWTRRCSRPRWSPTTGSPGRCWPSAAPPRQVCVAAPDHSSSREPVEACVGRVFGGLGVGGRRGRRRHPASSPHHPHPTLASHASLHGFKRACTPCPCRPASSCSLLPLGTVCRTDQEATTSCTPPCLQRLSSPLRSGTSSQTRTA